MYTDKRMNISEYGDGASRRRYGEIFDVLLSPPGSPIICEGATGAICRPLCRFSIKKGAYRLTAHTERAQRLKRTQYFSFFCFCPVLFGLVLCSQNRSYGRFENQAYGRFLAMLVLARSHIVKFIYYIDVFISSFLCGRCFLHHRLSKYRVRGNLFVCFDFFSVLSCFC